MKVEKKRPVPSPESARPTPGPWTLEYDGSVVIGGQISISPDSCGPDDATREERKANCRLIAAAPELLAACQSAQCSCSPAERESGHLVGCWFPAMQEAISKAIGGVA